MTKFRMVQPRKEENFIKVLSTKKEKQRLSEPIIFFFTFVQLIFGFNFGFVKSSGKFRSATYFVTIVSGCVMILILASSVFIENGGQVLYIAYLVQYVPFFIILLCGKHTVYDFLSTLPNGEESMRRCNKEEMFFWIYASLVFGGKCATVAIYCSLTLCTNIRCIMTNLAEHAPIIALDIIPIVNLMVFYHVYACVKNIVVKYKNHELNLKHLQNSYKEVADNFAKFTCNYDAIFVWWFITDSIKWMLVIWNQLIVTKSSGSWWLHGCTITWASICTMQICVPTVFAEMIKVQTDAMKLILHEKLLIKKDEIEEFELLGLLRYVEARPLLRKAWRLVPLDLRLPISMLSICVTYLIVIVQFTHLFD